MRKRILVVDDEPGTLRGLGRALEARGYDVDLADSVQRAEVLFRENSPDALLLDQNLGDGTGLDLMRRLRGLVPGLPAIVLTAHGSIEMAVEAIKDGAEQFLTKPVDVPALALLLERVLEGQRSRRRQLADGARQRSTRLDPFLGTSAAIRELRAECEAILDADACVLILGETGAGKCVLARFIHDSGARSEEAFVDLNCAGLSRELLESELFGHEAGAFTGATAAKPGLLEIAHRGTLFLDEIGDMELQIQAKLLKVLEERRFRRLGDVRDRSVDVRLIAATHQDLDAMVRDKRFRQDLYFRVNTFPLRVPALRERPEDIPVIADFLLKRLGTELRSRELRLSAEAHAALLGYAWPGNIRELRNVLERAVLLTRGSEVDLAQLRLGTGAADPPRPEESLNLQAVERATIERALSGSGWQIAEAARSLGISRTTLYAKIKQYELKAPEPRA